jgi:hypothetical protein
MDFKKLFDIFINTLALQMKGYHSKNVLESYIPFWLIIQFKMFKKNSIKFFHLFVHFLIEGLNICIQFLID